jgi:hypothetical protein
MRTVTIEVGGLLPVLRAPGVHKRLTRLPDVEKAQINNVAGSAMVNLRRGRPRSQFHQD